jgi:hypothetical protein
LSILATKFAGSIVGEYGPWIGASSEAGAGFDALAVADMASSTSAIV